MRTSHFVAQLAAVSFGILVGCGGSSGSSNPPPPDSGPGPYSLADQGKQFVAQRGCAGCHTDPNNPGVLAGRLTAYVDSAHPDATLYPANLTPDKDTGVGDWTDQQLITAIRTGVDDENAELCPTMPRHSTMSDDEAKAIVAYLRSLPAVKRAVPESTCPPLKP